MTALLEAGRSPKARWAVFTICFYNTLWALAGLIANPDFGTGASLSSEQVLGVDFNGWHALSGLLLFVPGMALALIPRATGLFALAAAPAVFLPGVWVLIEKDPMSLWLFSHQTADAILHFATAALLFAAVALLGPSRTVARA